jgi:salicylate hydroxylase
MYPTTGQGGSQSLEDVAALGVLLSSLASKHDINQRLQIFERLRKDRMSVVQALSGVVFGKEEEFAKERPWHMINKTGIRSGEDHLDFLYGYDIFEGSKTALEEGTKVMAHL